ncbi:hypothetical protein RB195_005418 [Necator americanus]|uniref:Uncharacterized protein n=1 Tax=Necator americanus TaxID=51031 RepID=A0ABR1BMR0_NECAM
MFLHVRSINSSHPCPASARVHQSLAGITFSAVLFTMTGKRHRSSAGKDKESVNMWSGKKKKITALRAQSKSPFSSQNGNLRQNVRRHKSFSPTPELCTMLHAVGIRSTAKRNLTSELSPSKTTSSRNCKKSLKNAEKSSKVKVELPMIPWSEEQPTGAPKVKDNDDEIVYNSQEMVTSGRDKEEKNEELVMKAKDIFLLYESLSGERYKHPEKTEDALRNEYRELFCIATMCEKLSELMSSRLEAARQLRDQRIESMSQLKALSLRLEDFIMANLPTEKYLSFDDTAQRDALEIMNIRYEELSDDIFTADDEFSSIFGNDDDGTKEKEQTLSLPENSSLNYDSVANYADLCLQSKLTEVGLIYVNAIYLMIKHSNAEIAKCRGSIGELNRQIAVYSSEVNSVREELGDLASIIDRVIGVTHVECSKTSMFKSRST